MAKTNLFNKAKEKGPKATVNDKQEVIVKDPKFYTHLSRVAEIAKQMATLKAESDILSSQVKETAIQEFSNLYQNTKKYIGSFMLRGTKPTSKSPEASMMFIPTDNYIKIDEERYLEITEKFGTEIAQETTTYTLDSDLVEKYGEILSDMIHKCKGITDEDKEKLISATTSYKITKGTIANLPKIVEDFNTKELPESVEEKDREIISIAEMVSEIRPIFQMKNIKLEEAISSK